MKKYKLIKTYPGSPKLGFELKFSEVNDFVCTIDWNNKIVYRTEIAVHTEFWEQVVEKDYELLSFKSSGGYHRLDPTLNCYALGIDCYPKLYLGYIFERPHIYTIHAVKRLSDGEVFTIGDKIKCENCKGVLEKISMEDSAPYLHGTDGKMPFGYFLNGDDSEDSHELPQKTKQPLFKTEDGVDVFEGDECYIVWTTEFTFNSREPVKMWAKLGPSAKYFSTLKAAEAYLVLNKPCLSYNDVMKTLYGNSHSDCLSLLAVIKSRLGIQP